MQSTEELDRRITLALKIRERLDGREQLSSVLSQIRLLMTMASDSVMVALVDILIHGLTNVPYQGKPFTDPSYRQAGMTHMKLCAVEDISKLGIDEIIQDPWPDRIPVKNHVISISVYEMENLSPPLAPMPGDSSKTADLRFQHEVYFNRAKTILVRLRAFLYDRVSRIWVEAVREKERIRLLGPDYRFITDRLDALETAVGGRLIAAFDALSSSNPDSWSLCALGCRNVVIKLGTILWKVPIQNYTTQNGKQLGLSGDKEKNRLFAYIDVCSKTVSPDKQARLEEATKLVESIYNRGSKGKGLIRYSEAQALVVDTFQLVHILNEVAELKPMDNLS